MSKRKRERMKEKAARHKSHKTEKYTEQEVAGHDVRKSARPASSASSADAKRTTAAVAVTAAGAGKSRATTASTTRAAIIIGAQPHLAQASPEWKSFYAEVSEAFAN